MKIMNKFILICSVLLMMANLSQAQSKKGCYDSLITEGKKLLGDNQFRKALGKFELAYDCIDCPEPNDLRKFQEECQIGIDILISKANDSINIINQNVSDLLLNLGKKELEEGNINEAVGLFFKPAYDLSSSLKGPNKTITKNLIDYWFPSLTKPLPEQNLYGNIDTRKISFASGYVNMEMPLLIPPNKIINLSRSSGDLETKSLFPGIVGSNIIFNREAEQIMAVIDSTNTVALWTGIPDSTVMRKIPCINEINQISPGLKGEYLAVSFTSEPGIKIYSVADSNFINTFHPKKENLKSRRKTKKAGKEFNQDYDDLYQYNQDAYQYDQYANTLYSNIPSDDNPPFLIMQDKLFYLHPDSITIESQDIITGRRKQIYLNEFKVHRMVSSPNENFIIFYGEKEDVLLYDVSKDRSIDVPSGGIIPGFCRFASDGSTFAVATKSNIIELFKIESGYPNKVSSHPFPGNIIDFNLSRKGDRLVTLLNENQGDQVIQVHSLPGWVEISGNITSATYNLIHAGKIGDFVYGLSKDSLYVWKLPLVYVGDKSSGNDHSIEINFPALNYLSAEANIRAIDSLESVIKKARSEGHSIYRAGLSPGFDYVAISSLGSDFYIYDTWTTELYWEHPSENLIRDFCFVGKTKIAAFSEDDQIYIYDLNKKKEETIFNHDGKPIHDFQPSQTGKFLSVTLNDGDVIIYSMESLQEYYRIDNIINTDNSISTPLKGWFSPGDKNYAVVTTDGKVMVLNLADTIWTDNSVHDPYSYTVAIGWENDSTYLNIRDYGYIDRVHMQNGNKGSLKITFENFPSEIFSIPGSNVVLTTSDDGYFNLHENMEGFSLGLPFIFSGVPEVLSFDKTSGDFMVYVRGDGFYKIQPLGDRKADPIQFQISDTSTRTGNPDPDLLGKWSFKFKDIDGEIIEYQINIEADYDSVYSGYYSWWYYISEDTNDIQRAEEPIECKYDPDTRMLKIKFIGEYSGMDLYDCRAFVSEDGKSLDLGTIESIDAPGINLVNWSGKKLGELGPGRSQQPGIRQEETRQDKSQRQGQHE